MAAIPADYAISWEAQLRHRREWAWRDVRRIGHQVVAAGRLLRATRNMHHYREWRRLRHELAFALRSWTSYRDWTRNAT